MAAVLDALGIERVGVMGTSGGGPTALQFALRHPKRTWALVMQSAISQRYVEPHRSTNSLLGRVIFSRCPGWLVDFGGWSTICLLAKYWPGMLVRTLLYPSEDLDQAKAEARRAYVRRRPEQMAVMRGLVASGSPLSVRRAGLWNDLEQYARLPVYPLERIVCPTLVLHGRADANVPFAHGVFVARTAPNAALLAQEDCGHLIWVGPGAEGAREAVLDFLRRHAPPAGNQTQSAAGEMGNG
jgi:pimeloyl-ACP methyl ester carboxylesterase